MRRGFTLLELLLVLAVLAVVVALAVPSFNSVFDGQKLRKSGDQIRAEWAKARNLSMKSGRIHVFRCKLGLDEYEIRPWYAADDALESSAPVGAFGGTADLAQPAPDESAFAKSKHLPAGILFAHGETEVDSRSAQIEEAVAASSDGEWGQPILFYTDGSSSTAKVLLSNRKQQFVSLYLRGLTGLSEVSDLQSQEEASQ